MAFSLSFLSRFSSSQLDADSSHWDKDPAWMPPRVGCSTAISHFHRTQLCRHSPEGCQLLPAPAVTGVLPFGHTKLLHAAILVLLFFPRGTAGIFKFNSMESLAVETHPCSITPPNQGGPTVNLISEMGLWVVRSPKPHKSSVEVVKHFTTRIFLGPPQLSFNITLLQLISLPDVYIYKR